MTSNQLSSRERLLSAFKAIRKDGHGARFGYKKDRNEALDAMGDEGKSTFIFAILSSARKFEEQGSVILHWSGNGQYYMDALLQAGLRAEWEGKDHNAIIVFDGDVDQAAVSHAQPASEATSTATTAPVVAVQPAPKNDWHMHPCKFGHRDVGAAGGIAMCNICSESIKAESTQVAFDQWNASHPSEAAFPAVIWGDAEQQKAFGLQLFGIVMSAPVITEDHLAQGREFVAQMKLFRDNPEKAGPRMYYLLLKKAISMISSRRKVKVDCNFHQKFEVPVLARLESLVANAPFAAIPGQSNRSALQ